jgi:NADH-quinone oxidoreductase subunit C
LFAPPERSVTGEPAALIAEAFGVSPTVDGRHLAVILPVERWREFAAFARRDLGCVYFNWLSAVDWKDQGLEVLCRIENLEQGFAVLMRTRVPAAEPVCPSLTGIYRGADWMERECYDMLGVRFAGHPDLRRILLPQDWDGYPLRKEYAVDTAHAPYR